MKCPKCQAEINSNSKFCTKCGCNLEAEAAKAAKPSEPAQHVTCAKCGAALMQGAKFCTKCGTPSAQQPIVQAPPVQPAVQAPPVRQAPVQAPPAQRPPVQAPPQNQNNKKQKSGKSGGGLIVAIAVLMALVAVSGTACFLVWNGTISLPSFAYGNIKDKDKEAENGGEEVSKETSEEVSGEDTGTGAVLTLELSALMDEADKLLADGKDKIAIDAEVASGTENIRDAMSKYDEAAQKAGDTGIAADKIKDGYASYVSAVIRHKDIMNGQGLSGSIYSQVMTEMGDAESLAESLSEKGYDVDASALTAAKDEFKKSYTEKVIKEFDEFTQRDAWSRTESWNLMSGFDGIFDDSDLDDPVRLRYAYALSWWIEKQIETELKNGTITEKGAAIKIANMIEAMDYNPMMMLMYIGFMANAGEDCTEVANAYDDIVAHIYETQGILVGEDIPLEKFWYFNDFGAYSVDSDNGVTPENRAWIRDRMKNVTFKK